METLNTICLNWLGPYSWPSVKSCRVPDVLDQYQYANSCGIYLWTVEHNDGYLIYTAGLNRRPFKKRFQEHTKAYLSGVYTVFDASKLKKGIRQVIWQGFWFKKRTKEMQFEYNNKITEIHNGVDNLLTIYRVFIAPLTSEIRISERIEAAIMLNLYSANGAASTIPGRGMALSPRYPGETVIRVNNVSSVLFHGLPLEFDA